MSTAEGRSQGSAARGNDEPADAAQAEAADTAGDASYGSTAASYYQRGPTRVGSPSS